jgi:membrane protein required for colicin V production
MNWLDLAVLGIVLLSAIFAFARGFVREALSIVAWVGAGAVTLYGFNWVYTQVEPLAHNALLSQLIAGFGLFVVSLIVLTILTGIVARAVRGSALSPIDRTLGFIFGLVRGAFLVCLAYLLLDVAVQASDRPMWIREAKSGPYLHEGADVLRGFLPESLKVKSATAAEELIRTIDPKGAAAAEAEKAMRALQNPTATPPANPPATPGPAIPPKPEAAPGTAAAPKPDSVPGRSYPPRDQRELDRLIGTQR